MKELEKNLQELVNRGAKIYLFKSRKYWVLIYKENVNAISNTIMGLNDIKSFVEAQLR